MSMTMTETTVTQAAPVAVHLMPAMPVADVKAILGTVKNANTPGKNDDGTRIHVRYTAFRQPTAQAVQAAKRVEQLGLPRDCFTGRVSHVWNAKNGNMILTMLVELERDHCYRSLNVDKGVIRSIVILGD